MIFDRWQAPDRDSPTILEFDAIVELGNQLDVLLKMEGHAGTREADVKTHTGEDLSRPRRWHKIFERMGLLYQDSDGNTQLTQLGKSVRDAQSQESREFRRRLARKAILVLRKYQLQNPADTTADDKYPIDADLHPYWAIWKAAVSLGGRLHWDELNRELMWVLKHSQLDEIIEKIRKARTESGYNPETGGSADTKLGDRAYDQESTTDGRDPAGQVRDQKTTPWFKRAGLGELLLVPPGRSGNGYWHIHEDVLDLLREETEKDPPKFQAFSNEPDWFRYFGEIESEASESGISLEIDESDPVYAKVQNAIKDGYGGVIFVGPPGTSKSWYAQQVAYLLSENSPERVRTIQFHPTYQYDDFVEGFVPNGAGGFDLVDKHFLASCKSAAANPDKRYVIVIDEISRCDAARVFGEVLTYLEVTRRGESFFLPSGRHASVPNNLFVVATMNPWDRGVDEVDMALERRFAKIQMDPDAVLLNKILKSNGVQVDLAAKVETFFQFLTRHANPYCRLGHAYFLRVKDVESLERLWEFQLKPHFSRVLRLDQGALKAIEQAWSPVTARAQPAGGAREANG